MPWGGDEWFTYNDYVLTGTPNNWLVMLLKKIFGNVSLSNFIWYRQVGLFWTSFIFLITYFILRKDENKEYHSLISTFIVFFTFSPFFIFQEQMFRYYGLFLFYSFLINYAILKFNDAYKKHKIAIYALLLFSLPIHILLTWQLIFYIMWKEFSQLKPKLRLVVGLLLMFIGAFVFLRLKDIMKWLATIMSGGNYQFTGSEFKGFSISSLLKPIISLFQYFFGTDILPTENIITGGLFLLLIALVAWGLFVYFRKQTFLKFLDLLFCSIIPFLAMFLVLQAFTLPGSTQLEAKHAMFVVFWFIYLFVFAYHHLSNKILRLTIFIIPSVAVVYGLIFSLGLKKEKWEQSVIVSNIKNREGIVLVDGPSSRSFKFNSGGIIDTSSILNIWDTLAVKKALGNAKEVSLTLLDYKSYQILTREQMWNTGTGSEMRNAVASFALKTIQKEGFKAVESYSHYPLMNYRYIKTNHTQPIPWFYSYAYADLHLPVTIEKDTVLGWFPYQSADTIPLDKPFYYMIESSGAEKITFDLIKSDNTSSQLTSKTEADKFRSHFCMTITGYDKKVKEWHKRPLLSSSLAYPGSYLPGTGYIYQFNPKTGEKALVVRGKDVKVWFGVEK